MWKAGALFVVFVMAACSGDDDGLPRSTNTCWRGEERVREEGRIELGTGFMKFEPLVDEQELQVQSGAQGLHHFVVNARMWGLDPGDIGNEGVDQPQTRFSAFFEDGSVVDDLDCSYPLFYVKEDGGDAYDLYAGRLLVLGEGLLDAIGGKRIRIVAEVVDVEQGYARDERWIVALPPSMSDAGAPDASTSDSGPVDAGVADASE
ncbi:MAG TPA: hypothetical protein VKB80_32705 [Kofleriaceae bacterium]|nr:hypothetical protein [Kofleriaceae bacterium]